MMESNDTMNSLNGSTKNPFNQMTVPLYVSYLKLFISFLAMLMMVPIIGVAVLIFKNKKLKSKSTFLLNLLAADVVAVLFHWLKNIIIIPLYLIGFSIDVNCRLIVIPIIAAFMATKLLFIPMSIDRFIHVAFPFKYKHIMTTKVTVITIGSMWLFTFLMSVLVGIGQSPETIPAIAACKVVKPSIFQRALFVMPMQYQSLSSL